MEYFYNKNNDHNLFPVGGISNRLTIHCIEAEGMILYNSDRYGFRNSDNVYNSEIDLVLIGDSMTMGSCVENEDNFAGVLSKEGMINVVNLGFSNNNLFSKFASFKEYALKLNPKEFYGFGMMPLQTVWQEQLLIILKFTTMIHTIKI